MPKNNLHPLARHLTEPMFITPEAYQALVRIVELNPTAEGFPQQPTPRAANSPDTPYDVDEDGIATLELDGVLAFGCDEIDEEYGGMCNPERLGLAFSTAANDPNVRAVMFNICSPGGRVSGTAELADAILACDRKKPVLAYASGQMGSAAYFAGSQARIVAASRSALVGSIGVLFPFYDKSEMAKQLGIKPDPITNQGAAYKTVMFPGTSLTPQQREYVQGLADDLFAQFQDAVLRRRTPSDDAFTGKVFIAARAQENGLVDEVIAPDQARQILLREAARQR